MLLNVWTFSFDRIFAKKYRRACETSPNCFQSLFNDITVEHVVLILIQ